MRKKSTFKGERHAFLVRTSPELYAELERLASERSESGARVAVNDVVVEAIEHHVARERKRAS